MLVATRGHMHLLVHLPCHLIKSQKLKPLVYMEEKNSNPVAARLEAQDDRFHPHLFSGETASGQNTAQGKERSLVFMSVRKISGS